MVLLKHSSRFSCLLVAVSDNSCLKAFKRSGRVGEINLVNNWVG